MKKKRQEKILEKILTRKITNQEKPDIPILKPNEIDLVKIYYV